MSSNYAELPTYLFHEGTNYRSYQYFGAHFDVEKGESGVRFRVWAPNAAGIAVVGNFNGWNTMSHPMHRTETDGTVWETFIPGLNEYAVYKYAVTSNSGKTVMKADPYAFHAETRPANGSKIYNMDG